MLKGIILQVRQHEFVSAPTLHVNTYCSGSMRQDYNCSSIHSYQFRTHWFENYFLTSLCSTSTVTVRCCILISTRGDRCDVGSCKCSKMSYDSFPCTAEEYITPNAPLEATVKTIKLCMVFKPFPLCLTSKNRSSYHV